MNQRRMNTKNTKLVDISVLKTPRNRHRYTTLERHAESFIPSSIVRTVFIVSGIYPLLSLSHAMPLKSGGKEGKGGRLAENSL